MKFLSVVAAAAVGVAAAVQTTHAASLKDLVRGSLEQAVEVEGVNNCENKCQNLLGFLSYYTAEQQQKSGVGNNEYRGCMLGCNQCNLQQSQSLATNNCFDYCKNYAYAAEVPPIKKGVIEPDKACIIGCVIQLCQGLCTGDGQWTQDGGGCQIQSGYGVQTYNIDQSNNFASCCIGLQNVCTYGGKKKNNSNYDKVVKQAHKGCDGSTIGGVSINSKTDDDQMCVAYQAAVASAECGAP